MVLLHVPAPLLRVSPDGEAVLTLAAAKLVPEPSRDEALPAVVAGPRAVVIRWRAPVAAVVADGPPSRG